MALSGDHVIVKMDDSGGVRSANSRTAISAALTWGRLMTSSMSPASAMRYISLSMGSCGRR